MKATALLDHQHRRIRVALKRLAGVRRNDPSLLDEVASELVAHMVIEETIFYPAVRRLMPDVVAASYEEHALGQVALKRLLATAVDDPRRRARILALHDVCDRHFAEEQGNLFREVETAIDADTLFELGLEMKTRFDELVVQGHASVLPGGPSQTTSDRASFPSDGEPVDRHAL